MKKTGITVLGLLLASIGLLLAGQRLRGPKGNAPSHLAVAGPRVTEKIEPLAEVASARSPINSSPDGDANAAGITSAPLESAILEVLGEVVVSPDDMPLVNGSVRIIKTSTRPGAKPLRVAAETNDRGQFSLKLDASAWRLGDLCNLEVIFADNVKALSSLAVISQGMLVRVPRLVTLKGKVVDDVDLAGASIRFDDFRAGLEVFLANAVVQSNGLFEGQAFLDGTPEFLGVSLQISGFSGRLMVPTADLLSDKGADLLYGLQMGLVRVKDYETWTPIAEATIRSCALGKEISVSVASTDSSGEATLFAMGPTALCVFAEGYSTYCGDLEAFDRGMDVSLHALSPNSRVSGRVIMTSGNPVPGAYVALTPSFHEDAAAVGAGSCVSGADGSFSIPASSNVLLQATAYLEGYGLTAPTYCKEGDADLELVIPELGTLRFGLAPAGVGPSFQPGMISYVAVGDSGVVREGVSPTSPVILLEVPAGEYEVCAYVASLGVYAEGRVTVSAGEILGYELPCFPAGFVEGTLTDESGLPLSGFDVRALGLWPAQVEDYWAYCRTDSAGQFKLMIGREDEARVAVAKNGDLLIDARVSRGSPIRLTVPN